MVDLKNQKLWHSRACADSVITTHMGWWSHLQEQMQNNGQRCWHHLVQQLDHLIPDSYGMTEISEKNEDNYEDCNWAVEMSHQVSDLSRTVRHKHQLSLLPKLCKHVDFQHPAVGSQSWHSRGKHCWQHQQSPLPWTSWRLLADTVYLGPQSYCFEAVYI